MTGRRHLAFTSWSSFGQTALLIFAALFAAQFIAFFLIRGVVDQWQRTYVVQPALRRFTDAAERVATLPPQSRTAALANTGAQGASFRIGRSAPSAPFGRRPDLEAALSSALQERGIAFSAVVAWQRGWQDFFGGHHNPLPPGPPPDGALHSEGQPPPGQTDEILLAVKLRGGDWLSGRLAIPKPFPMFLNPIFISQAVLFVMLLGGTLFWAARLSRPLRSLAEAAARLRPQDGFEPLPVNGPRDVRTAITSFNAMALRLRELLAEKDRMLSAIGHDLRTPLASLRIRAENIEPDGEREKIVETIDEMTAMIEEILSLARQGHVQELQQLVDLSALADTVVEDYRAAGGPVEFIDSPRAPVLMQVGQARRLIRNLIDNAVKYGERATVAVRTGTSVDLVVEDEGPGIPPGRLDEVKQPFTRLENSRSRQTGGSGLGLSIADAIARRQGAELILENRAQGGLRAIIRWPA